MRESEILIPYQMRSGELQLQDPACCINIQSDIHKQAFGYQIELDDTELNDLIHNATQAGMLPGEYIEALIHSAIQTQFHLLPTQM